MADPAIADLDAHLESICLERGIRREASSRRGRAFHVVGGAHYIRIPPVRSRLGYLIGLHELGHLIGPGRSAPRLEAEANAWKWALGETIVEPTPANLKAIGRRLLSYRIWAENRQHRKHPPRFPPPEHDFWRMVAWSGPRRKQRPRPGRPAGYET
jgi:hypothetical protein